MAAISALIKGDLSPVGNPVSLKTAHSQGALAFEGYSAITLGSGTEALALAMLDIKLHSETISFPEVLIPGYACPDLVSAAVYSGLKPVLIDINRNSPCLDLSAIRSAVNNNTVAIIAVNFLGISDDLYAIRELVEEWPAISLIEDNAQWYPELKPGTSLLGDYVCLSFGRGKPVSLLGGGALLTRNPIDVNLHNQRIVKQKSNFSSLILKVTAYNLLLHPFFYQLVSRNPWLKLGQTAYKSLEGIKSIGGHTEALLEDNVRVHLSRSRDIEHVLKEIVSGSKKYKLIDLVAEAGARAGRLLRYPILCETEQDRDEIFMAMSNEGLGASKMYKKHLLEIRGVDKLVLCRGNIDNAKEFSSRLITIPVHQYMDEKRINRLKVLLS